MFREGQGKSTSPKTPIGTRAPLQKLPLVKNYPKTLTRQSLLFFDVLFFFCFLASMLFVHFFLSLSWILGGSAKRKTLAFWVCFPCFFPKAKGFEGQRSLSFRPKEGKQSIKAFAGLLGRKTVHFKEGKRPTKAHGQFSDNLPRRKTAPPKRPTKRSMTNIPHTGMFTFEIPNAIF